MINTALTITAATLGTALVITTIVAKWKMFEKMGEKGWKSLIPIYGSYKIFDKVWSGKAFLVMLLLNVLGVTLGDFSHVLTGGAHNLVIAAAVINAVACIALNTKFLNKLAHAFGHGAGYTVLGFFCEPIATMIYGFGKDEFLGKEAA